MFLLVLKIFFESLSKVLMASTCIYVANEGRFDALQTIIGFYACVFLMIVFNMIFTRRPLSSPESWIGKKKCKKGQKLIKITIQGVTLNSFSSVATFTNMNFHSMFDRVAHGHVKEENEAYHESTLVKQIVYNIIMICTYLG